MKLIILDPRGGVTRTLRLPTRWRGLLLALVLALPLAGVAGGFMLSNWLDGEPLLSGKIGLSTAQVLRERLARQQELVAEARQTAEERLKALTVRVAEMQARLLRLDALGERLTRVTGVGGKEFDFTRPPAIGGPHDDAVPLADAAYERPDFLATLDELQGRIDRRQAELAVLETLLAGSRLREETFLAGNPVRVGYLSSGFGRRIDPFHGNFAFHAGFDFAGPEGSDIVATGSGMVVFAGRKAGYGEMVEVSHGDGISTVYAHCSKVLVRVGDIVSEGQVVAKLGNTGRSTGPHVHYEVRREGKAINPSAYVAAAR
jgi:murein DD-endopeptidase MepM/ murein hydrolase activator NlpD